LAESLLQSDQPAIEEGSVRSGEFQAQVKPTPHCPVEQLGMVGSRHDDDIRRQRVNLQEQGTYDSLDLTGVMGVASLFSQRVELVKEKHAMAQSDELKDATQPESGLTKVRAYDAFVFDHEQGEGQGFGDGLRQ
jgi:hypothetical protein